MDRIICIIGPSCAGKTTASNLLNEKLEGFVIEASFFPRERYKKNDNNNQDLISFVKLEFNDKGKSTFAIDVWNRINKEKIYNSVIIDGFRTCEEIDFIKNKFTNHVTVIGIYASSKIRYKRYKYRKRDLPLMSYEDFIYKDMIEYDFGIARMFNEYVDLVIINEKTKNDLTKKIYQNIRIL